MATPTKCVHVLASTDYSPEVCEVTLASIEAYAKRIGADYNRITGRRFPDYPINYERMQIFEMGKGYDFNINIDADMILGPQLIDVTTRIYDGLVGTAMVFKLSEAFPIVGNPIFENAAQDVGLVDMCNVTNRSTHAFWEPLSGPFVSHQAACGRFGDRKISEYCVSMNFHKHHYGYAGLFVQGEQAYHLNYTTFNNPKDAAQRARNMLDRWGGI